MTCKFDKRLLTQYSDGELSQVLQAQVRAHVNACPDCAYDLHILTSAVAQLRMNAAQPMAALPDLYNGFQERLITRPTRFSFAHAPQRRLRLWQLAGVVILVACAWSIALALFPMLWSHHYNIKHPGHLDIVASALSENYDGPLNTTEIIYSVTPNQPISTSVKWYAQGYTAQTVTSSFASITKDPRTKKWIVKYTKTQTNNFLTPTGVQLMWQKSHGDYSDVVSKHPVTNEIQLNKDIALFWDPKDPEEKPAHRGLEFFHATHSVLNLLTAADRFSDAETETTEEETKEGTCRKITLKHINTTLGKRNQTQSGQVVQFIPDGNIKLKNLKLTTPQSIEVWINGKNRICHEKAYYIDSDNTPWVTDLKLDYVKQVPTSEYFSPSGSLRPDLPMGRPTILGRSSLEVQASLNPNGVKKPMQIFQQIDLRWLTMSEAEKKQVQDVVDRFAHAWKEHDETTLRTITDVAWPLEITRTDKRKHLTEADVWQRVWRDRLSKEPRWKDYNIAFDFAYTYKKHLLDSPPLDADNIKCENALPGLNVLAWVKTYKPDGKTASFPANLYLVKRSGVWKIYQFLRDE